ncbi:MAG: BtrH N-terminal domain-containing protein [Chitinophagales bacterium]|nr:BtrH N-terminal domain-containing protein [Chitinophagaceae bacterium]MCB9063523.1 BtrH N-terminal domain-containing protein [Chitinophagales bacterium]
MILDFKHYQHAHCESGVTTNLLRHEGVEISEPLVFGIGAGLFFAHIPFVKVSGTPGSSFRSMPGTIFKRINKSLGVDIQVKRFGTPEKAMQGLDEVLKSGKPVGMQTSVYYLPYLPEAFRFHFNAHNLVVFGKNGDEYMISDPVMEEVSTIAGEDLSKARFAKGFPEPKGFMYYVKDVPKEINFEEAIKKGIKKNCWLMLSPPLPWFGINAIFLLSKKIKQYPKKLTPRKAALYLGNIIRMQEEIGTGGAGFRFLYAAFLQEAADMLKRDDLARFAEELTEIGDLWRNFAYSAARQMKARKSDLVSFDELGDMLEECGVREKSFFKRLEKVNW